MRSAAAVRAEQQGRRAARVEGEGRRGVAAAGGAALTWSAAFTFTPISTRRLRVARSPSLAALRRASSACGRSHPLSAHRRSNGRGRGACMHGARRIRLAEWAPTPSWLSGLAPSFTSFEWTDVIPQPKRCNPHLSAGGGVIVHNESDQFSLITTGHWPGLAVVLWPVLLTAEESAPF